MSDDTILRKSIMKFRRLVLSITRVNGIEGVDPFKYVTLASTVMATFKTLFLKETVVITLPYDKEVTATRLNDMV